MPRAFLVNPSLIYIVEFKKTEKRTAKIIGNIDRLLQERCSRRDFQLGQRTTKSGRNRPLLNHDAYSPQSRSHLKKLPNCEFKAEQKEEIFSH